MVKWLNIDEIYDMPLIAVIRYILSPVLAGT